MKSLISLSAFAISIMMLSACKKNPDTTMVFHITNDTPGAYVINMSSQYKSDVESATGGTFEKSLTVSGEYNVRASGWQCHVSNSNNLPSHITITMTFNNGTPNTCSDNSAIDLWCQGQ